MQSQQNKQYSIKIVGIDKKGHSVKILSPMDGDNPVPVKKGTRLVIHEKPIGGEQRSYIVKAGTDPNLPSHPHQFFDEELGKWVLIVQQPEERPIGARSAVRVEVSFDVNLSFVDSNRQLVGKSKDLSATGMLVSVSSEHEIQNNSKVVLYFQLPDSSYKLPPITGKIIRVIEDEKFNETSPKRYDLGIEFDEFEPIDEYSLEEQDREKRTQNKKDQDEIIRFVLKKQGL